MQRSIKRRPGKAAEPPLMEPEPQQAPDARQRLHDFGLDHRRSRFQRLLFRLREDFRLAMVTLYGFIAASVIAPFSVFRFAKGDLGVALLDLGIVLTIVIGVVLTWRFDKSESAGKIMAALVALSAAIATLIFNLSPLWALAVLVASFLLASSWFATILSLVLILLVVGHDQAFSGPIERWTFLAVSVQVALFSLIFSLRSNQRTESLAFLADTDPLTGLGNRRALRHDLTSLVSQNRHHGLNLALAMLDLDHFKRVNDEYGHEIGDRVLVDFAGILAQSTRESDQGYRFGGEEFVVILQGVDAPGLEFALEKLQKRIRERLASPDGPVTVSIGATRVMPGDTVVACFQRADQAMYQAKASGRDRFEIL